VILIVGGVAGTGKTTVGALIAGSKHWRFADADAFHSPENVAKMRAGLALTDADRGPWLAALGAWIDERIAAGEPAVVTCSALKRSYRAALLNGRPSVRMVFLSATPDELHDRLATRPGHFFPAKLLESQLAAVEPPGPDEHVLTVRTAPDPNVTAARVLEALQPGERRGHCTGLG
jgi:gluconokinase